MEANPEFALSVCSTKGNLQKVIPGLGCADSFLEVPWGPYFAFSHFSAFL